MARERWQQSSAEELENQIKNGVTMGAAAAVALTSSWRAGAAALPKMSDSASAVIDVEKPLAPSRTRLARRTQPRVARAASMDSATQSPVTEATTTKQVRPLLTSSGAKPRYRRRSATPSTTGAASPPAIGPRARRSETAAVSSTQLL